MCVMHPTALLALAHVSARRWFPCVLKSRCAQLSASFKPLSGDNMKGGPGCKSLRKERRYTSRKTILQHLCTVYVQAAQHCGRRTSRCALHTEAADSAIIASILCEMAGKVGLNRASNCMQLDASACRQGSRGLAQSITELGVSLKQGSPWNALRGCVGTMVWQLSEMSLKKWVKCMMCIWQICHEGVQAKVD